MDGQSEGAGYAAPRRPRPQLGPGEGRWRWGAVAVYGRSSMPVRGFIPVAVLVVGAAGGCAGGGSSEAGTGSGRGETPVVAERLVALPRALVRRCAALAGRRDIRVLVPTELTAGHWRMRHQTLRTGRHEYLCDFETHPPGAGEAFHILAGGRGGRFSLRITPSGEWPRDTRLPRDLGLVGAKPLEPGERWGQQERVRLSLVQRTAVAAHPALMLRVADYPDGGLHGGHLAVVWNQEGAGYALSIHFANRSRRSQAERQAALLRAATTMSRFAVSDAR